MWLCEAAMNINACSWPTTYATLCLVNLSPDLPSCAFINTHALRYTYTYSLKEKKKVTRHHLEANRYNECHHCSSAVLFLFISTGFGGRSSGCLGLGHRKYDPGWTVPDCLNDGRYILILRACPSLGAYK